MTVGPLKLTSIDIAGELTMAMKDMLQFWVQKKMKAAMEFFCLCVCFCCFQLWGLATEGNEYRSTPY